MTNALPGWWEPLSRYYVQDATDDSPPCQMFLFPVLLFWELRKQGTCPSARMALADEWPAFRTEGGSPLPTLPPAVVPAKLHAAPEASQTTF